MISLIVAHDPNRVIGKDNKMPWHIRDDLKYFKKQTLGKAIVMGRNTFESIGKPLPGRLNVVVTRNENYKQDGASIVHTIPEAIEIAKNYHDEVMIIGGEQIFRSTLPYANRLYVTFVQQMFDGDTFFPEYGEEWKLVATSGDNETEDGITFSYLVYEKKSSAK